jgi:AraC-like DNA-binding protein/quercetin dioxygenase-like cupin family protein
MKPSFERIEPNFGSSFSIRKISQESQAQGREWHFHPEYEIVYLSNGSGKRHIGTHISYFQRGDLIFIGPDLPHFGFTKERKKGHFKIVAQMKEDFLGEKFLLNPEMSEIRKLFERSHAGISFHGKTKKVVGQKLDKLYDTDPFGKMIGLLEVLHTLAISEEYENLNARGFTLKIMAEDEHRIQHVYEYVQANFKDDIKLEGIAKEVSMTVPAFCRYFKRLTNQTFIQFVNEFRVAVACKMLLEEDMLIANVAHESGFNNLSHFNKQFIRITGQNPLKYRQQSPRIIHLSEPEF